MICITTFTDAEYAAGTAVMIASVLRHNPWFDGEIIILHDGRELPALARLARFPRVSFRVIHPDLRARVADATAGWPGGRRRVSILSALDAFALTGFAKVLKIDSDIVCRGDLRPVFETDAPLACCADYAGLTGRVRDRMTYAALRAVDAAPGSTLNRTFNAGVMLISPASLGASIFHEVLGDVRAENWAHVSTGHSDSVILNRRFDGRWTELPEIYNYLLPPVDAAAISQRRPVTDAVLLHVLGSPKPWQPGRAAGTPDRRFAFDIWDHEARLIGPF